MLPFLKRKDQQASSSVIIKDLSPEQPVEPEIDPKAAHRACARHLLLAIEARDVDAIADALYDAFTVMESADDIKEEAAPHSFEAQNIKAGEQS